MPPIPHLNYLFITLACCGFFLAGGGIGYSLGRTAPEPDSLPLRNPIIEISYTGGHLENPEDAVAYHRIYGTGEVYQATRGGNIMYLGTVDRHTLRTLREQIKDPATQAGFIQKERSFCISSVDGIDTEIALRTSLGKVSRYSDCVYALPWEDDFLKTIVSVLESYQQPLSS